MTPEITIIVPVYNAETILKRALDSIRRQTFTDFECILVDDGSSDKSGEVCDAYAAEDGRFRVIHQENMGHPTARNVALDVARGKYIGFVDADDCIHPDMYLVMVEWIKKTQSDWVVSQYVCDYNQDTVFPEQPPMECRELNREQTFEYWYVKSRSAVMWMFWNKLYSRELIGDLRVANFVPGQDQDFNFKYCLRIRKCAVLNQVLYHWILRDGSVTRKNGRPDAVVEKHTNLLRIFAFLDYTEFNSMTEKEKGYLYTKIIQNVISCREVATKAHDTSTLESLKHIRSVAEPLFRSNRTIPTRDKCQLLLLLRFPVVYKLYLLLQRIRR